LAFSAITGSHYSLGLGLFVYLNPTYDVKLVMKYNILGVHALWCEPWEEHWDIIKMADSATSHLA
jgi:hypothetical protein